MLHLFRILALLLPALAALPVAISHPGPGPVTGKAPLKVTTRIVNGRPALKNEIPYVVALGLAFNPIYGYSKFCGGAIFSSKFIITAAHCFWDNRRKNFAVMAGGLEAKKCFKQENKCGNQVITFTKYTRHPGYNVSVDAEGYYDNDIAVVELDKPLELNDGVQPIPIAQKGTVSSGKAVVSGWGDTKMRLVFSEDFDAPNRSHVLLTTEVEIIPRDQCDRMYLETKVVDVVWWSFKTDYHPKQPVAPPEETMLCAGDSVGGGKDICTGDSGGPLQCSRKKADGGMEKYLCGVVSNGVGCGLHLPSAYTDVAKFHDWIVQHTNG